LVSFGLGARTALADWSTNEHVACHTEGDKEEAIDVKRLIPAALLEAKPTTLRFVIFKVF
jgi:hypothetical protein